MRAGAAQGAGRPLVALLALDTERERQTRETLAAAEAELAALTDEVTELRRWARAAGAVVDG